MTSKSDTEHQEEEMHENEDVETNATDQENVDEKIDQDVEEDELIEQADENPEEISAEPDEDELLEQDENAEENDDPDLDQSENNEKETDEGIDSKSPEEKPKESPKPKVEKEKKLIKKLWVSNLPHETTNTQVRNLFSKYGKVTACLLLKHSRNIKSYAHVTMSTVEEADKAIKHLHKADIGKNIIQVVRRDLPERKETSKEDTTESNNRKDEDAKSDQRQIYNTSRMSGQRGGFRGGFRGRGRGISGRPYGYRSSFHRRGPGYGYRPFYDRPSYNPRQEYQDYMERQNQKEAAYLELEKERIRLEREKLKQERLLLQEREKEKMRSESIQYQQKESYRPSQIPYHAKRAYPVKDDQDYWEQPKKRPKYDEEEVEEYSHPSRNGRYQQYERPHYDKGYDVEGSIRREVKAYEEERRITEKPRLSPPARPVSMRDDRPPPRMYRSANPVAEPEGRWGGQDYGGRPGITKRYPVEENPHWAGSSRGRPYQSHQAPHYNKWANKSPREAAVGRGNGGGHWYGSRGGRY